MRLRTLPLSSGMRICTEVSMCGGGRKGRAGSAEGSPTRRRGEDPGAGRSAQRQPGNERGRGRDTAPWGNSV
ncbi:hypothetical protein NDU88_004563 [Pleurodeles waltl]|uniref:Uncharacterized protein n=1 Tax=Pleurodeles waltl TaxID=8319 RepID=A0AAV7PH28_PLEWA|nr:hypothetical protein NDU88_004563 [Pleurodeles waltl]